MKILKPRRAVVLGFTILVVACAPSYVRAFVVAGDSDAPAYSTGDRVLVNLAAYDIRLPYSGSGLARLADPVPGDMVLFRLLDGRLAMKRVIAGPGHRVAMRDNHLEIDGVPLRYTAVSRQEEQRINRGRLGGVMEIEQGNGPDVFISFDRDCGGLSEFDEQVVSENHYFVLGSNRDHSMDSRQFGLLSREQVLGKVIGRIGSAGQAMHSA